MSNILPIQNEISNVADEDAAKVSFENQRDFISSLLGGAPESELTIASGNITPLTRDGGGQYKIDTQSNAASDDLANILTANIPDGQFIVIRPDNTARTVVVKDAAGGAGQIHMQDNADFSMTDIDMSIMLRRRGSDWYEIFRQYGAGDVAGLRTFFGLGTADVPVFAGLALTGNHTNTGQPAFLVRITSAQNNVTGKGEVYTVLWPIEIYDQGADFASNTFTAPVTGLYLLMVKVAVGNIDTATADDFVIRLVTSNRTYVWTNNKANDLSSTESGMVVVLADMDAADTVTVIALVSGMNVTDVDIVIGDSSFFSGVLLA